MASGEPRPAHYLRTIGTNAVTVVLAGVLALSLITLVLRLPQRIQRGEQGQAAIEMLDAMRRPFLEIKQVETRLLQTFDAEGGNRALASAIDSASSLLSRYQALARYSAPLSRKVAGLLDTFQDWGAAERRLFSCVGVRSAVPGRCLVPELASAADGFLRTLNDLGAGETLIHADIADGRTAGRLLQAAGGILLLYLTGLAVWSERRRSRRERALVHERLRAEERAHALDKSLSDALAKALSGFISICAYCKRVRVQENEWTPVEAYVTGKTEAKFSHGICPACNQRVRADFFSQKSRGQPA